MKTNRVGVFSGTFDPIHVGHVEACLVALAACELEKILVMVEKKPMRKELKTSSKDRLEMVRLALNDYPSLIPVELSGDNVTVEGTLKHLNKKFAGYKPVLIIGSDVLKHLEDWQDVEKIYKHMEICVVLRTLSEEKAINKVVETLKKKNTDVVFHVLPPVWSKVSSSIVKKDLKENGASEFINKDVLRYIKTKEVY